MVARPQLPLAPKTAERSWLAPLRHHSRCRQSRPRCRFCVARVVSGRVVVAWDAECGGKHKCWGAAAATHCGLRGTSVGNAPQGMGWRVDGHTGTGGQARFNVVVTAAARCTIRTASPKRPLVRSREPSTAVPAPWQMAVAREGVAVVAGGSGMMAHRLREFDRPKSKGKSSAATEWSRCLAVGETVILLTLPLPLVGVSIWMKRGCQ